MSESVLDVAVIGTGFSGICAGIKLKERGITNFAILEKSKEVGGTWRENSYPGAACDVPAPLYCYSFAPNPDWSRLYPPQAEIKDYIQRCADRYEVTPHIRFEQQVLYVRFNQESETWGIELASGEHFTARHVILGPGGLHHPSIPEFSGLDKFKGPSFHTAQWDHTVDFTGKRVAVIGSAASAIQCIPELAKTARDVHVLQRTPNYISERGDRAYTPEEKTTEGQLKLREEIFVQLQKDMEPMIPAKSDVGKKEGDEIIAHMKSVVANQSLHKSLAPEYDLGCKRILISDNFYQTLNEPHVHLETDGIDQFTEDGILTKTGKKIDADVVVFATGFDLTTNFVSIQYFGRDGTNLIERWIEGAKTYRGAMVPGYPNLYWVTGPNTGVATTSVVVMIEAQLDMIMQAIEAVGLKGTIEPKDEIVEQEDIIIQDALSDTVWAKGGCNSWYQSTESSRIATLYPYGVSRFIEDRRVLDLEHFVYKRSS